MKVRLNNKILAWTFIVFGVAIAAVVVDYVNSHPTPKPRKEENVRIEERLAQVQVDKRVQYFNAALAAGNTGVACKVGREVLYWAAQTHDADMIKAKHDQMSKVCGHE